MLVEDKRALDIMRKTVKEADGHLSLGLLWKDDKVDLEDNRSMALRRLEELKRGFMADPDLFLKYQQKMVDYIENGYAELIPSDAEAPPGRTYYIQHHCTSAFTKFRVVFDCSAKFRGKSLNDMLLQRPQLTNSVAGVFLRSREWPNCCDRRYSGNVFTGVCR